MQSMAAGDVRYQTIMLVTAVVAVILVLSVVLLSGQDNDVKTFVLFMNALLVTVNVIGFFLVWGSDSTLVDEIFVMTPSGMLLKHYTRRLRPDQDENIMAGMLTAVQNFIKESFDEGGGRLREIKFENLDIMISYSDNVVLAAVIASKNPQKLKEKLSSAVREIESLCGHKLKDWDGDMSDIRQIDGVMKKLLGRI
ncbi:MAG TPA: hypothetical protein ENN25_06030 [Euryarchaeota archaeon]|nr:hypothetical protein [Euryarchaeota archaeon]